MCKSLNIFLLTVGTIRIGAVDMFNYSKLQSVANEKQTVILEEHINKQSDGWMDTRP